MATIAVFLALCGSSYAALKMTGEQVVDRSLSARDIKDGSWTSRQIKDGSLHRIGVSVTAVLFAGNNSFPETKTAYVAPPGTYTLRLDGRPSDGLCSGNSRFWSPVLTYVLL